MSTSPFLLPPDSGGSDFLSAIPATDVNPLADALANNAAPIGLQQTSDWIPSTQLVDPTNTGDTGALHDTSTPLLPSVNNPETAGTSSLGAFLNTALNDGFAAWQLSSQPKGTPKVVTTQVGTTKVASGAAPSVLGTLLGGTAATPAAAQTQSLIIILVLLVVGFLIYKAVAK